MGFGLGGRGRDVKKGGFFCFSSFDDQAGLVEFKGELDLSIRECGQGSINFIPGDFQEVIPGSIPGGVPELCKDSLSGFQDNCTITVPGRDGTDPGEFEFLEVNEKVPDLRTPFNAKECTSRELHYVVLL